MAQLARYWHTLRHLKPQQIYRRVWLRLYRPRPDERPAPPLRRGMGAWQGCEAAAPSLTGPGAFHFLGVPGTLADSGWDGDERSKLWRYNQHYFDDLNATGAAERRAWHDALIANWISANPPGVGTGWEPYPVSLRIVNWVKFHGSGRTLADAAVQSLAVQARWLMKRLEYHLLGNHLFANAKALVFAGALFDGPEAAKWLARGAHILSDELGEQVLPDGGHFELSPMYHAIAVEDVLDIINVLRVANPADLEILRRLEAVVPAMLNWLATMSHPDGEISFFNDAAIGIAPPPAALFAYAARLGFAAPQTPGTIHLAHSGYARMQQGPAMLLADLARIGPDYLPGHAHADTLGFEFSFGTQRVFVNSGTSEYGLGEERLRQRGTAAHNCVTIACQNSSDVWSGFRVGRRARPGAISFTEKDGVARASAVHDGYRHLPGRPIHQRSFALAQGELVISDQVQPASEEAIACFNLHPSVQLMADAMGQGRLLLLDGVELHWQVNKGEVSVQPSSWHPGFGVSEASTCLTIRLSGGESCFRLAWT